MGPVSEQQLFYDLQNSLQGEICFDELNKMLFATDASMYQQTPIAVARPKTLQDCITLLNFSQSYNYPIIPRAAGTSLAGQVVGRAIIVDTSRYLNKILNIDVDQRSAVVQAGVVIEQLNQQIRFSQLKFAPDPSTKNRCNIAGVIGNNAWGAHAPRYGSTRAHIKEIELLIAPGEKLHCRAISTQELRQIQTAHSAESTIYNGVTHTIEKYRKAIIDKYPQRANFISNSGYALDKLALSQPWITDGERFNLCQLICGSEGTLGLIHTATVQLSPITPYSVMLSVSFDTLIDAMSAVSGIQQSQADAIELLDNYLLSLAQSYSNIQLPWLNNKPQALLLVEYIGDDYSQLEQKAFELKRELMQSGLSKDVSIVPQHLIDSVWDLRRAALGFLMGMDGRKKPISFIEDSAVPAVLLPQFVSEVQQIMTSLCCESVYYGSVSMGLIHIRPLLDLGESEDRKKLELIATAVADSLLKYGGTMSAKHGDGRARSPFLAHLLGPEVMQATLAIKNCFDAKNLFNPDKITTSRPLTESLRIPVYTGNNSKVLAALKDIYKCNGAAVCRKTAGDGTMCPSYMATQEELHLTRGRANVARQILSSLEQFEQNAVDWVTPLMQSLELCIACKGCRNECPAGVDMARVKTRCLDLVYSKNGIPFKTHWLKHLDWFYKIAATQPAAISNRIARPLAKVLLSLHPQRSLPNMVKPTLSQWFAQQQPIHNSESNGQVLILNDFSIEYFSVDIGQAAIALLQRAGFKVVLSPCFESIRTVLSQGLLSTAESRLRKILDWVKQNKFEDSLIIGLEPSELLTFRDEALDLLEVDYCRDNLNNFVLFEEFVQQHQTVFRNLNYGNTPANIVLHIHCHQKSLAGIDSCVNTLCLLPDVAVDVIPSGCCGMAGLFGYNKKYYDISKKIGELVLLPHIRSKPENTLVATTGFSCRHQIKDLLQQETLHPAQILFNSLTPE